MKFQSIWYKDDIVKIEEKLKQYEEEFEDKHNVKDIQHDFEFKFCKYSVSLDQDVVRRIEDDEDKKK